MKGILFKQNMVQAIMHNSKTVTRRLQGLNKVNSYPEEWAVAGTDGLGTFGFKNLYTSMRLTLRAPLRPGQVVYVKEGWKDRLLTSAEVPEHVEIKVWNSPMFMPAWAARIFLEIVSVRSERLQTITEDDAIAEGIHAGASWITSPIEQYAALWDSINTKPGTRWADNPFVFRYEFRRTEASERDRERYI